MTITVEDGFIEVYVRDTLIRVNYKENKATVGCNGDYMHITVEQFNRLMRTMESVSAYAPASSNENGE